MALEGDRFSQLRCLNYTNPRAAGTKEQACVVHRKMARIREAADYLTTLGTQSWTVYVIEEQLWM